MSAPPELIQLLLPLIRPVMYTPLLLEMMPAVLSFSGEPDCGFCTAIDFDTCLEVGLQVPII